MVVDGRVSMGSWPVRLANLECMAIGESELYVSLAKEMMEVWTQEKPSNVTAQPPDASRYIIFGAGSCYHRR